MTDTQPFMDEALALWATLPKESAGIHAIATALSSAYQRGREEERERAAQIVLDWQKQLTRGERIDWHAERIAFAIRTERDKG